MKVSVVVTAYNAGKFIAACLDSIIRQTRKPDEILLCDDCSTDGTLVAARPYMDELTVVSQSGNVGPLRNTLAGLRRSTGDIVAFIDGDDLWPPEKIERVVEAFTGDPRIFLVSHGHERVSEKGEPLGVVDETHRNMRRIHERYPDTEQRSSEFGRCILHREGFWLGSAYSIRRSSLDLERFTRVVLPLEGVKYAYMDMVLAPFLVQTNPQGRIVFLPDVVFQYRIHGNGSGSGSTVSQQLASIERLRATNAVTWQCLLSTNAAASAEKQFRRLDTELEYMRLLYLGHWLASLALFIRLVPHLLERKRTMKELARLVAVGLLGPRMFLKHKRPILS